MRIVLAIAAPMVCILAGTALPAMGQGKQPDDPTGVLRKSIPDKLVVLTFDDGCASGYTVADPILKSLGFGGSFYVCDFDSFKTRKDWYLTWRQMKALIADGFEVGNHTKGHGSSLSACLAMEDELFAHDVLPKPTTVCWPLYMVGWDFCPELAKHGYTFGRGGYVQRPYRPTMDNPFDVPSYTLNDGVTMEAFTKIVRRAVNGKVVVLTYHGVPDLEHAAVSVKSETFKAQMQYLKDNHYKCIALRDMAEYIDPVKAATLPRKPPEFKESEPFALATEDKPYVAPPPKEIHEFSFPGLPSAEISRTGIRIVVPYTTDVTALAPRIKVSAGATVAPASGEPRDFSRPQTYTVTGQDGSKKSYLVTVTRTPISSAKDILKFEVPGTASPAISGTGIGVYVPRAADVTALAPTFKLPPFAAADPASGTTRDFTKPQMYTITAQDGSTKVYSVTVVKTSSANSFTWNSPTSGNWNDSARWTSNDGKDTAPLAAGRQDYILTFNQKGSYTVSNNLNAGFLLNRLNLATGRGLTLAGNGLTFTRNSASGVLPAISVDQNQGVVDIDTPMNLASDLHVNMFPDRGPNTFINLNGLVSGAGALNLNCFGLADYLGFNNHDASFGIIRIRKPNAYSGGTRVNGGKILVESIDGLGTGPVTMDNYGTIADGCGSTNSLTINTGYLYSCKWCGPVTLNGIAYVYGDSHLHGPVSGPGGLLMIGTPGVYLGMTPGGTLTLYGENDYKGPTTLLSGTLVVKKAAGLYHAEPAKWTSANITVHRSATLRLSVGGPGEFSGCQVSTLLANLTTRIDNNGLLDGSAVILDTANATEKITLSSNIVDSQGAGGGWFVFKKTGGGVMEMAGRNTYTGQTVFDGGTLIVSSLNSVADGKASSSLGSPTTPESGLIELGGNCTMIYTGNGEITDRILDFTGEKQTVTIDQSGSGLLRFASAIEISGYGHSKALVLKGSGAGEFAGAIKNPYDRKRQATLALAKEGAGIWTLSGSNSYSGPTLVSQGVLVLAGAHSLGPDTEVTVADGATLELKFNGEMKVAKLTLGGVVQPAGMYSAASAPKFIKGTGVLAVK